MAQLASVRARDYEPGGRLDRYRGLHLVRRGFGDTTSVQQQITQAAQSAGVDPALALAVAKQESGFNQSAVSGAGAIGVMQLMPATASWLGVNPNDQASNIAGGVKYLAYLSKMFNGDPASIAAAYNEGQGAFIAGKMPAETTNYVSKVMSNYGTYSGVLQSGPAATTTPSGDSGTTDIFGTDTTDSTTTADAGIMSGVGSDWNAIVLGGILVVGALVLFSRR